MAVERRLPEWFKVPAPGGENYLDLKKRFRGAKLHTVCEEAACPNIGDCWGRRTATFMILGDTCTRACSYCNVKTGWPGTLDAAEPFRLAQTVQEMDLKYTVVTSVDRDDLPDAGAGIFAMSIREIHRLTPNCKVEVLIPDFGGSQDSLAAVVKAQPEVLNHNIETVRRVFKKVRPKGDYDLSLELIRRVKEIDPRMPTKSGMMVGLGETMDEVLETMRDLRAVDCDLLTVGQYLRPSQKHHPLIRFYHPREFEQLRDEGMKMGFKHVAAGPLVRSSYHADEQHEAAIEELLAAAR
ncbi:MAG: lipoyl synthase [Dehalococcoidia bacterium]